MARDNRIQMFPHEWRASTTLSGVYALRMLGMFLVLPVLAMYAASLPGAENNKALVGMAMGIYGLTQALLQLPLGMASDKFGRKKVIYAGLIVLRRVVFWPQLPTACRCWLPRVPFKAQVPSARQ